MGKFFSYFSGLQILLLMVGLMSGLLSLLREGLTLYAPARFGGKFLLWRCVWIAFILSMWTLWIMEHRANLDLRQQIEASTKPIFEIEHGTYGVFYAIETRDGVNVSSSVVFFPLVIFNRGAPSVVTGWNMKAVLVDGRTVYGTPFQPSMPITFTRNGIKTTLKPSQSFFVSGFTNPIVSGGQASGYVMFKFPEKDKQYLETKGTKIYFTITDITHHPWALTFQPSGYDDGGDMQAPPSMYSSEQ